MELVPNPLIAVAGLTGAGKTTGLKFLALSCGGSIVYLGSFVLDEVRRRGLAVNPENERTVRAELRACGPATFAELATSRVLALLGTGMPVLVDAIFAPAEYHHLQREVAPYPSFLLGIEASFEVRCERLARRLDRPAGERQVRKRDQFELQNLKTGDVLKMASHTIVNEGTNSEFEDELTSFLRSIGL